jgi:hypothetical protein
MKKMNFFNIKRQEFIDRLREQILFDNIEKYIKIFDKEYNVESKATYTITELEIEYNNYNFNKLTDKIINDINNNYKFINNILDNNISEYGIVKQIYNNHFSKIDNYIKSYCYDFNSDFYILKKIIEYNKIKNIKSFIKELENNNLDVFIKLIEYSINYYINNNIKWSEIFGFIYPLVNINSSFFEKKYDQYMYRIKDILFDNQYNKDILIEHYKIRKMEDEIKFNNIIKLYALHCYLKNARIQQEL